MKKALSLVIALILILSLASCGRLEKRGDKDETGKSHKRDTVEVEDDDDDDEDYDDDDYDDKDDEDEDEDEDDDYDFKDMYEYVDSIKGSYEEFAKSYEEYGIKMTIEAEDESTLLYRSQYMMHLPEESYKATIASYESIDNSSYIDLANELEESIASGDIRIVIRYINDNGDVIWESEYDKDTKPNGGGQNTFDSIDEYIESGAMNTALEALDEQLDGIADYKVKSEGDNVVIEIRFLEQLDKESAEEFAENYENALESGRETLEASSKMMELIIKNVDDPHIVYRVLNKDKSVICELTY